MDDQKAASDSVKPQNDNTSPSVVSVSEQNAEKANIQNAKNDSVSVQATNALNASVDVAKGAFQGAFNTLSAKTDATQPQVKQDEKIFGAVAYIMILFVFSLIMKPDSAFVRMHSRQSMLMFITYCFGLFLIILLTIMGLELFATLLGMIVSFGYLIIAVFSMYQALNGVWWKIPLLGKVSEAIPIEFLAKVAKDNVSGQISVAEGDYQNRQETLTAEQVQTTEAPVIAKIQDSAASTQVTRENTVNANDNATNGAQNNTVNK